MDSRLRAAAGFGLAAFSFIVPSLLGQDAAPLHRESVDPLDAALADGPLRDLVADRFLLTLDRGSADALGGLRTAIRAHDPEAAAREVDRLEQRTAGLDPDFSAALAALGGEVVRSFWLVPVVTVHAPGVSADALASLPGVRSVAAESVRAPGDLGAPTPLPILTSTNGQNHRADIVQLQGVRGQGVTVAIIDSGLDEAMGTAGRPHRTFYPNGQLSNSSGGGIGNSRMLANVAVGAQPADGNGLDHGTRVAGVAIGGKWNANAVTDDGHAPEALVVGYSLTDQAVSGITTLTTMVAAWQQCVADAARFGTSVAVISYDGTNDPYSPEQQAMDAAADVGDLAIAAMAGNSAGVDTFYQAATNLLAVGSVTHDLHSVSTFSATGPIAGPVEPRLYPHLMGNGQAIDMPAADNEGIWSTRDGTSYSAPQVGGAMALFRSVATSANHDETRAAVLATLDDLRAVANGQDARFGHGYLRDDRLVELARGNVGRTWAGTVDIARPAWSARHAVTAGKVYSVALAWSRRDTTAARWSDLDISVLDAGLELVHSEGVDDTHHVVTFKARTSGNVDLVVRASRFESGRATQDFGVAFAENPRPIVRRYGQGCPGPATIGQVQSTEPLGFSRFGATDSNRLIGGVSHRAQQWTHHNTLLAAAPIRAIAFRHDDITAPNTQRSWVELELSVGFTELANSSAMSTTFAQNGQTRRQTVLNRKRIALPLFAAPNQDRDAFDVLIPFDQSFSRLYDVLGGGAGNAQDLVLDVRQFASSAGAVGLIYPIDAEIDVNLGRTLWAPSPNATTGTITPGLVVPYALVGSLAGGVAPSFELPVPAAINTAYRLRLDGAPATATGSLAVGVSDTGYAGIRLPVDLGIAGAPGCYGLASLDVLVPMISFRNQLIADIAVPGNTALLGASIYHQAWVFDPSVNVGGLLTSDAIEQVVGFR